MSIIKRKPDKQGRCYHFSVRYHNIYGKLKQYNSKAFLLKKDAVDAERQFLLKNTNSIDTSVITMNDLFNQYLDFQKDKVKVTSYIDYKKYLNKFECIKDIKVNKFNINHFNLWKETIDKENYSTTYKNKIYSFLVGVLRFGEKYKDYNLSDVMRKMNNFTNHNELKKEMNFYTYDEFIKFISCELDLKYKCFFEMLYYCGLRKEEANSLNWNDINFNDSTISINKSLTQKIKGKKYVIIPPKTKSSIRVLKMPKILSDDLLKLKEYWNNYKNMSNSWFAFGGIYPLVDTTIQREQLKLEKLSEQKHIRIHDFRHSCASLLINNGASILLVSKYLGHSNIATTLNTYSHLYKNQFDELVKTIDNLDNKN